jgi:16S rRNA G527 N7-methylase RsmG
MMMGTSGILSAAAIGKAWERELKAHEAWLAAGAPLPEAALDPALKLAPTFRPLALAGQRLEPSPACLERLEAYAHRVLEVNEHLNLVSRRDPEQQILINLLDSLPFAMALAMVSRETEPEVEPVRFLLDAGSGSGVPGLPVHLVLEDKTANSPELLLVESRAQKADFLDQTLEFLRLDRAGVWGGRLEDPSLPLWLEEEAWSGPGCLLSRALGSVADTMGWCRGLQGEEWLREALLLKGIPGFTKEWLAEGRSWARGGWSFPAQLLFMGSERPLSFLWGAWR